MKISNDNLWAKKKFDHTKTPMHTKGNEQMTTFLFICRKTHVFFPRKTIILLELDHVLVVFQYKFFALEIQLKMTKISVKYKKMNIKAY